MLEKKVIEIVVDAERELHQAAGMSVQVYSQDRLAKAVQDAFNLIFDDVNHRWKRYEQTEVYTLDGTTGRTTTPVKNTFKHYEDILSVYPGTSVRALVNWSGGNPSSITGKTPIAVQPDQTDVMRVLPYTSGGQITVVGKVRPALFTIQDVVPFDYQTIVYLVAWQYMIDDGTNAGAAEKLRNLFEQRYDQMKKNTSREPIALNSSIGNVPLTWRDDAY